MPRFSAPSQQTTLHNHPSWENHNDTERALGPVSGWRPALWSRARSGGSAVEVIGRVYCPIAWA